MNLKDKIIRKLLDTGKKHRILVYPMLALVAIISAVSNAVYWGRGNKKRVVASVTVMALLITQSLFLTSSANNGGDLPSTGNTATSTDATYIGDNETGNQDNIVDDSIVSDSNVDDGNLINTVGAQDGNGDMELQPQQSDNPELVAQGEAPLYTKYRVYIAGTEYFYEEDLEVSDTTYSLKALDESTAKNSFTSDASLKQCFDISGYYFDDACAKPISNNTVFQDDELKMDGLSASSGNACYVIYTKMTVNKIQVNYFDSLAASSVKTVYATSDGSAEQYSSDSNTLNLTIGDNSGAYYCEKKNGYTFAGISNGGTQYAVGNTPEIALATNQLKVDLTVNWQPKKVEFQYDAIENSDELYNKSVTENAAPPKTSYDYNAAVSLPDPVVNGWAEPNEGYVFSHWEYNGQDITGKTVEQILALGAGIEYSGDTIDGGTIVGKWEYKDCVLYAKQSDGATYASNTITGEYGTLVSVRLGAKYTKGDANGDKFAFGIASSDIVNVTNKCGVNITYAESSKVTVDGNQAVSEINILGTFNDVTEGITIPVNIYDLNRPSGDCFVKTENLTFVVNPKTVTINSDTVKGQSDTSKAPYKSYNGDTDIAVNPKADLSDLVVADAGKVWVEFDSAASFDTADAGENKTVTIKNVHIVSSPAELAKRYNIVTVGTDKHIDVAGIGTIERKSIKVKMKVKDSDPAVTDTTVKYGENNPEYELYLEASAIDSLCATDKAAYERSATSFITNNLGFTNWEYTRTKYSPAGTDYKVTPQFSADKNYVVDANGLSGKISVTRDVATVNVNYKMNEQQDNGYYQGLTITPTGDYDQIRICSSASDDITADSQISSFKSAITDLPDMTNGTVYIQMRNSATNAITTIGTITNLNIDTSAPELKSFSVDPFDKLNIFNFGAYYHPQDGKNVVTFTFKYEADDSPCDTLYYFLEDSNGNRIGDTEASKVLSAVAGEPGMYQASITLNLDQYGQLIVYAVDTTGNKSPYSRIKIADLAEKFDSFSNVKPSDYYEWMVENTITGAPINVSCDGATASTDGVWYHNLDLSVAAEDTNDAGAVSGINHIDWVITDENGTSYEYTDTVPNVMTTKVESYTFSRTFPAADAGLLGNYTIAATLYDNADNSVELTPVGSYMVDSIKPVITDKTVAQTPNAYLSGVSFDFEVTEGSGESGINTITLYQKKGSDLEALEVWSNLSVDELYDKTCSHTVTENGTYVVIATDKAGNESEVFSREFTGISDVKPDAPTISVSTGVADDSGWYIEKSPKIKITANNIMTNGLPTTTDGVPIHTDYSIKVPGSDVQRTFTAADFTFDLDYEGPVTIEAVNVSASNVESAVATSVIKVDTVKPVIEITGSSIDSNGNLVINYEISDKTSGVNISSITINGDNVIPEDTDDIHHVIGSFVADKGTTYTIEAKDVAGNEAEAKEFKPLDLLVSPVMDITTNSALLKADIYVGTYDLSDYYIAYRKHGEDKYTKYNLVNKETTPEGISLTCPFKNLNADTVYDYKVYAITKTSQEVKSVEGSFKTGKTGTAATVYGNVSYDKDVADALKTYPIYVSISQGNVCVGGMSVNEADDGDYIFKNVADGSYQITATNGFLSQTASVTVENGGITYPKNYSSKGGVNLVLSGYSTAVDIEDSEINLTADDLDIIYDDDFYVNITRDDYEVVNNGGHILITLHARYLNVASNVTDTQKGILQNKLGENAEIVRYIELYVTKTVTDSNGNSTTSNITELLEPITISFPLGDLAGQKIYVASLHGSNSDYSFYNWGGASDAVISNDYVTISTSHFSLYALYRYKNIEKTYTVKWIDGDGRVMKTETVKAGGSATPPTAIPTKTSTDKYTYQFEKWDKDYSNISADTIVSSWFIANKIQKPGDEGDDTETPSDDQNNDQNNNQNNGNGNGNPNNTQVITPNDNNGNVEPTITKTPNHYTYLGSAESPKTADATPFTILLIAMGISFAGFVTMIMLKKKKN